MLRSAEIPSSTHLLLPLFVFYEFLIHAAFGGDSFVHTPSSPPLCGSCIFNSCRVRRSFFVFCSLSFHYAFCFIQGLRRPPKISIHLLFRALSIGSQGNMSDQGYSFPFWCLRRDARPEGRLAPQVGLPQFS